MKYCASKVIKQQWQLFEQVKSMQSYIENNDTFVKEKKKRKNG